MAKSAPSKKVETKKTEDKKAEDKKEASSANTTTVVPHSTGNDLVTEQLEGGGTKQSLEEHQE